MFPQPTYYDPNSEKSLAEQIACLPQEQQDRIFQGLTEEQAKATLHDWRGFWARKKQIQPDGEWVFWLVLAGRGFGKTRTGAETVREWGEDPRQRILMIAPTANDVQQVMLYEPAGLMSCYPPERRPVHYPSKQLIQFPSGAIGITRSADEPERLRGPEFSRFWADELCAWRFGHQAWDQIMFGFRQQGQLRGIITTTPKVAPLVNDGKGGKIPLIKSIWQMPDTVITRGTSYENSAHLSPVYYRTVIKPYEGTRLGQQEINAALLEDLPGALWSRGMIERARLDGMRQYVRVVVAIDPAVTANEGSDHTGIVVVGLRPDNWHIDVLADGSMRASPGEWAREACRLFLKYDADRIVAETNNGGDLVEHTLRGVHHAIPYRAVHASRGKAVRAEPVAALYETGRVHHVGCFPELEDQMCGFVPGQRGVESPDRMDALVWAIYDLVLQPQGAGLITYDSSYSISPI